MLSNAVADCAVNSIVNQPIDGCGSSRGFPTVEEYAIAAVWMAYAVWMARRMQESTVDPFAASERES